MKHTTSSLYAIDHINAAITVSKTFLKEAGIIGSDCYQEMLRLRRELPLPVCGYLVYGKLRQLFRTAAV